MNAITLLKQDHRKVRGLFRDFDGAGDRAVRQKQRIAEEVFDELEVHTTVEQELFYPAVQNAGGEEGKDQVLEAIAEHDVVKNLIDELKRLSPEADEYDAKFTVLEENVKHHMEEEEGEMFPFAEKKLDETQLRELGRQMADRKQALSAPSMIGQSVQRAKKFVGEVVAAISPIAETSHRRTTTHKRTKRVAAATPRSRKRAHASHGRGASNHAHRTARAT